jgi:hypothetical protein
MHELMISVRQQVRAPASVYLNRPWDKVVLLNLCFKNNAQGLDTMHTALVLVSKHFPNIATPTLIRITPLSWDKDNSPVLLRAICISLADTGFGKVLMCKGISMDGFFVHVSRYKPCPTCVTRADAT